MDSGPSDETLLVAVAERDMRAFRTLYERHAGWLAIRLARRCNDRDLVADAIQDTFVAVWQKPRGFRGDGDIAAWLWEIAIRRLVSRLRTRSGAAVFEHKEWTEPAARHAEVRRALDLVGLSDLGAKRIRAMSGGQRRRVALAQALLGSPAVLILDEPTTGVDPEQRVVLRTVLAEIARTSVVVLSTHQTEDVAALCERVVVGWQLALCAIAVLVALLRGAEGPARARIIRALVIAGAAALILLVLAGTGGFAHAVTA